MKTAMIVVQQILQMFLLAGIGFVLFKTGKITREGSKTLGNILIYLVLPAVIINSFRIERTAEQMIGILYSACCAIVLLLLSIVISRFVFRKDAIAAFASAFSNAGFFGIPLIIASVGQGAVFYIACFIAFLNIGQWSYGVSILTGQPARQEFQLKKLVKAPYIIAILIGLALFFTQIRLPDSINGCLTAVSALNTPLAMFTVGVYLAQTDIFKMLKRKSVYTVSLVRLLVIPFISLLLLALLPESLHSMKLALLLAVACPAGSNVAIYAQLHGKDYPYAVETVIISTLFSAVSIPLLIWFASVIW